VSTLELRRQFVTPGVGCASSAVVCRGRGALVYDEADRPLIDFVSGIGVMSVGHGNPRVLAAVAAQLQRLTHVCFQVASYPGYAQLAQRLAERLPHGEATKVLLTNTGAESVENAIKVARMATGRAGVLSYSEAFHGRTLLGMSLTSKVGYKAGCGPFAAEVYRLPFPNFPRYGDGLDEARFVDREIARFEHALKSVVAPEALAAVLIEVVQGEGGFNVAPSAYLRHLRKRCSELGVLLICDEVQCGLARTGRWAAYEHAGIVPDLSTWAKALGGGLPIGAVVGEARWMDRAIPGTLGGTFAGNPLACAAALAVLEEMEAEDLCARALAIGAAVRAVFPAARGLGAMMAIDLASADAVRRVCSAAGERGVLVIGAGTDGNILRLLPPLTIDDATLQRGLAVLKGLIP
jgi:4-aminobutyrate aminotransferase/(S)-3-amino-2-methylpropionate transaminase